MRKSRRDASPKPIIQADLLRRLSDLDRQDTKTLIEEYRRLFGAAPSSTNQRFLRKRIAWRLQANVYGGLSSIATAKLDGIIDMVRLPTPRAQVRKIDKRNPQPGTLLKRTFGGREHEVRVLENSYEYQGKSYASLSAVARAITGTRWNGYAFFALNG